VRRSSPSRLIQLCYASVAAAPFDEPALLELLNKARVKNAHAGITGILLYGNGHFVQLLEGEAAVVDGLYAKIVQDPRHQQVFKVYRQEVGARDLPDWSMAFERLAEFKPEFLRDSSKARALVTMFLEQLR
jgi:hypothetical protein